MKRTRCPNCDECMKKESARSRCLICACGLTKDQGQNYERMCMNWSTIYAPVRWMVYLPTRVFIRKPDELFIEVYGMKLTIDVSHKTDQEIIDIANKNIARYSNLKVFA